MVRGQVWRVCPLLHSLTRSGNQTEVARHAKKVPLGLSHPTSPINRSLMESSGRHRLNLLIDSVLVTVGHPDLMWLLIRYNMKQTEYREMFLPKKFSSYQRNGVFQISSLNLQRREIAQAKEDGERDQERASGQATAGTVSSKGYYGF